LTNLLHRKGQTDGGATLAEYSWTFDAASRITQQTGPDGTVVYTHDQTDQLLTADHTSQTDETYSYDLNGNRTLTGYETGSWNRLLEDPLYTYQYDNEGNRIRKTNKSTGDYEEYTWDHRNRLTRVAEKTSGGTLLDDFNVVYDVFDRRIATTIDADGAGPGVAVTTRFVYDGDQVALAFDGAGSLTNRYLWGPSVDQLLADEQINVPTNDLFWALADHLGSIRDLIKSDTTLVKHLKYDSYGKIVSDSNPSIKIRYAYTGREFEAIIGLQWNRARWYDHAVGRWISVDPIGFEAGDANWHRYVGNGPLGAVDPRGLEPEPQVSIMAPGWRQRMEAEDRANEEKRQRRANEMARARYPLQRDCLKLQWAADDFNDTNRLGPLSLDQLQGGLATAGIGDPTPISDILDGLISLTKGDFPSAFLSFGSAVPYVGDAFFKPARLARMGAGAVDGGCDLVRRGPYRGGAHAEMKSPTGDGFESHHMPADAATAIPRERGPAIQMDPLDHARTSSNGKMAGSAQYRAEIENMIQAGNFRGAMAKEIRDVRRVAEEVSGNRTKYNEAIREMLDYAKREGYCPPNPKR